jgi:SAM-dependent methyltransferase
VSVVLDERVQVRDGIAFADDELSAYRARWEDEAESDHVLSAIAATTAEPDDLAALTAKTTTLWQRLPPNRHVPTLVDIGTGYGRIPLHLSAGLGLTCNTFCGVDISESMLRRLLEYRARFDLFPGADVHAICASTDELPIAKDSTDLAVSSAVFLHMGKAYVHRALAEVTRVLRPGGAFVFEASFPNSHSPANFPPRLKPARLRNPNALKYWSHHEIERAICESGLAAKAGPFRIEPASFGLLPKTIGSRRVPLARRVNGLIGEPSRFHDVLAVSYSVYSESAFT